MGNYSFSITRAEEKTKATINVCLEQCDANIGRKVETDSGKYADKFVAILQQLRATADHSPPEHLCTGLGAESSEVSECGPSVQRGDAPDNCEDQDVSHGKVSRTQSELAKPSLELAVMGDAATNQKAAADLPTFACDTSLSNDKPVGMVVDAATMAKHKLPLRVLPNGTVGRHYEEYLFDPGMMLQAQVRLCDVICPEGFGLKFHADDYCISGEPKTAGEFKIQIRYQLANQLPDSKFFVGTCSITVNADPKSLWKTLPVDSTLPYQKRDEAAATLQGCDRRTIAASQRGRSHAHEGKFRDDDFLIKYLDQSKWHILAVADGAGSAPFSRKGSEIACHVAVESIASGISSLDAVLDASKGLDLSVPQKPIKDVLYTLLGGAALKAHNEIKNEAQQQGRKPKDYATTLIVSVVKKMDAGWFVGAFWVGDGGVGVYRRGGSVELLGEPDGGEFAGQTRFLTSSEIWDLEGREVHSRVRYCVPSDFTAVILMTDGVSDPKFETECNLKSVAQWDAFWDDLASNVNFDAQHVGAENELLKWLAFWSPGNHDDRTIAILY